MDVVIFGNADMSFVMSDDSDFAYFIQRDDFGNELRYEDSDGAWYEYTYNERGFRISYKDDTGRSNTWVRDRNDQIIKRIGDE